MKKFSLLIFAIGVVTFSNAQQFSFQMMFIDAAGNRDTLTLGYDAAATDTLDSAFGEMSMVWVPFKSGLDVRASNVWFQLNQFPQFGTIPFETKKQILPDVCETGNFWDVMPIAEINIVSTHFPVKAFWNKSLFNNFCRNGSVFTSVHPGGWWDTGGFREELIAEDSTSFYQNQYYYLDGADTVNVYWVAFSDSTLLSLGSHNLITKNNSITIFPNPVNDMLNIETASISSGNDQFTIFNILGKILYSGRITKKLTTVNISNLISGVYFIEVGCGSLKMNQRFIKVKGH